jgi:hypothetical protein
MKAQDVDDFATKTIVHSLQSYFPECNKFVMNL